jgi:hypothetical protein
MSSVSHDSSNAVCSAYVLLLLWHMELQIAKSMEDSDKYDEELVELLLLAVRYEITISILFLRSFGKLQLLYLR